MIGRGTGALWCVVNVERSLVGDPSVLVDLHCVSSQISFFQCLKPVFIDLKCGTFSVNVFLVAFETLDISF